MPPPGCCLGSVNLTNFVSAPFTERASFDFERFGAPIETSVRMLDNVLDATAWLLPGLDQPDQLRLRFVHRAGLVRFRALRRDHRDFGAHARQRARCHRLAAAWARST